MLPEPTVRNEQYLTGKMDKNIPASFIEREVVMFGVRFQVSLVQPGAPVLVRALRYTVSIRPLWCEVRPLSNTPLILTNTETP